MTRKEKCTMLRLFLMNIAEKNNCIYLSSECGQDCDCSGPCKKLNAELCSLLKAVRSYGKFEPATWSARSLYARRFVLSDPDRFHVNSFLECPEAAANEDWHVNVVDLSTWEPPKPEEPEEPDQEAARAMEELLASPVAELDLGVRAYSTMMRYGTRTIGDLAQMSERDFMMVPEMNTTVFLEIKRKLEALDLYIQNDF